MFIERKINTATNEIELWKCEWENIPGKQAKKIYVEKIGVEQPIDLAANEEMVKAPAICWSYGRTLGNIAVFNQSVVGQKFVQQLSLI